MSDGGRRVLLLTGKLRLRSSCLFLVEFAKGLMAAGCSANVLCSGLGIGDELRRAGLEVQEWHSLARPWQLLLLGGAMRRMLRERDVDLVHVHGQRLGMFGRRLIGAARVPVVYSPHPFRFSPGDVASIQAFAERVVVTDQDLREDCVNAARVPREKISLIPQGVNVSATQASPPRIGERSPVVGVVGPLVEGKGHDVFLRCVRELVLAGKKGQFIVAGDGPQEQALRRLCRDLDIESAVTFVTRLGQFHAVLESLDIFVRPSVSDGLAFTLLKAMAMGKAAVATDIGSVYSMIEDGVTGRLVSRGRHDVLASAIGELLSDATRAQQLGRRARDFVRSHFDIAETVRRTLDLYEESVEAYEARGMSA